MQVGQPLASVVVPLGHIGSQPSAGHGVGGGGGGGVQVGPVPPQSQVHGGQFIVAGSHPGQPQAQPPPLPVPPSGGGFVDGDWHTPDVHGWPTMHGTPSAYHWHWSAVSALHDAESVCCEHGSVPLGAGAAVGAGTAPPEPQSHVHGGQVVPAGQAGQPHVQVPPLMQPPPDGGPQSHLHGGQLSPGAHAGQAQVQVPPPVPPPVQSHSGGGQGTPGGHATGVTHAHGPPLGSRAWQKPPDGQVVPSGHRSLAPDQAQLASASHCVWSVIARQGSGV